MSLRYKLFGIPKTFEEFVNKVKRKEQRDVTVVLGKYVEEAISYGDDRHYKVRHYTTDLKSKNVNIRLSDVGRSLLMTTNHSEIEKELSVQAKEIANKLNSFGLETKVDIQL